MNSAKIYFESRASAMAAVAEPPSNLNVSFDRKMIPSQVGLNNNTNTVRINHNNNRCSAQEDQCNKVQ